jgi:tRNA pseudouridine38-40 synthase
MSQGMIIHSTNVKQTQVNSWILNVSGNFVVQVHSLCTVISMKMEVPTAAWVNDFDGITLAESINRHLPPFIRIFGIVPVTRSFRARHDCCTRTYNYLLPAAIIGIQADTSPLEVEERVEKFQSILCSFEVIFFFNLC